MSHGNGSSQGKRQKKQLSNNEKIYEKRIRSGYGRYIVPGAIGTVVILLIPFIANIWISLHSWRGGRSKMKFIGLDNYVKLLGDEKFWTSFSNSLYMIVAMVIIPLLIGLPDVYLEVQHPCWSCNSNSSSANASAGVR